MGCGRLFVSVCVSQPVSHSCCSHISAQSSQQPVLQLGRRVLGGCSDLPLLISSQNFVLCLFSEFMCE